MLLLECPACGYIQDIGHRYTDEGEIFPYSSQEITCPNCKTKQQVTVEVRITKIRKI